MSATWPVVTLECDYVVWILECDYLGATIWVRHRECDLDEIYL